MSTNAHFRESSRGFLKKLFARGPVHEHSFNDICKAGCDAEALGCLLNAVCIIAVGQSRGRVHLGEISPAQLKRLTRDLRSLADRVERLNRTTLNPKYELLAAPPDAGRDPMRKNFVDLYDGLPNIMRFYSFHVERFERLSRAITKRLRFTHWYTFRLLVVR